MCEIDDDMKFKRFLYFYNDVNQAIVRKQEDGSSLSKMPMNMLSEEKYDTLFNIIETAAKDESFPDRKFLFFVLAQIIHLCQSKELNTKMYAILPNIFQNTEEFFLFIKYDQLLHKNISSGVQKVIRNFYLKTEPLEFYDIITKQKSYYGWSHKDLIRLGHLKTDDLLQDILLSYVCKDLETAKKKLLDNKQITPEIEDVLKKLEELNKFKHCQDEKEAVSMIKEHRFVVQQVPSNLLKSQIVWETLIPQMEIPDVIKEFNRFNRLGFFKPNNPVTTKIIEVLTNAEKCKKCKIHPVDVLIEMKMVEKGKPMDPNLKQYLKTLRPETKIVDAATQTTTIVNSKEKPEMVTFKNNAVLIAMNKLLASSFRNPQSTGRRVMITVELREKAILKPTFGCKTVNYLEAAAILILTLFKTEKDVTIATFNGENVNIIQLTKGMSFNQICQKLKETNSSYVILNKPFQWATEKNKHIDVFVNILHTGDAETRTPKEVKEAMAKEEKKEENVNAALKKYKSKMKLINTKLINVSLMGRNSRHCDGSKCTLDIVGFNSTVPKMIEAFCKGSVL